MAGTSPFFITGANCKIKIAGVTLAFATDVSYSVQIATVTPKVLGMYEGSSVEPMSYIVNGSFTLVRYAKQAVTVFSEEYINSPDKIAETGNGIGNWNKFQPNIGAIPSGAMDTRVNESLDPSRLADGPTFDLEIHQKIGHGTIGIARIRNARITQADFSMSKKSLATQRFTFTALYVDEDSFQAVASGTGQQNT